MDESRSEIQSFYKGKTIFVTGAPGFMGKVLIEKLLYSCSDLDKIYILLRPKRGRNFDTRLIDMFKLPLFDRIRNEKPQVYAKVIPLNGDISLDNLGITEKERECLINQTHIVFHCAATLRLEGNLKDAIEINVVGTKRVLELAKQMKRLQAFVHLSTAFCHVDQMELGERIYDSPHDPEDLMRLVQWLDNSALDYVTPKILTPHPNTYTYSKRLAETLVAREWPNLPCAIGRPSIVIPSLYEPMPGWVDNLNGPTGLLVGAGKGVIRSMHCNADYHAEMVPVDIAINGLIAISYTTANDQKKSKSIPVYNVTQSDIDRLSWGDILEKGRSVIYDYPFEGQIWYPDGDIRSSKFVHNIFVIFFHIIPAYLIDFLMLIFRQKRFMVRIQKRISCGLEVLQYFTTREWVFHNSKFLDIHEKMSPIDQKIFKIRHGKDEPLDIKEYMKKIILGTRQYCMKENLSTLPRARRHQKVMYVIHLFFIYLFYFGVLYLIYKNFETARFCLDYTTEKMKSLPLVRGFVDKSRI